MKTRYCFLPIALLSACSQISHQPDDEATAQELGITVEQLQKTTRKKQLSNQEMLALPDLIKDALVAKAQTPTGAQGRTAWRMLTLRDENGHIPHDAQMKALEQIKALAHTPSLMAGSTSGGLSSSGWKDEGPGTVGGRVRAIAFHPTTPSTMFCGSVSGGLWRSTNSGASWSKVNDLMSNLAITSIVFDPGNSSRILASTGEGFAADGIRGAGIFRSLNGGVTWSRLASTNTSNFYWVNRLSYNNNGTVVLAATSTGVWRSQDDGNSWVQTRTGNSRDVKFSPNNPNIAIAESSSSPHAHFSTNGGVTWNGSTGLTTGGNRRVEFAWSRGYTGAGNGVVYALKDSNSTLYRSTNGGNTFAFVSSNTMLGSQGWYDNALWVAPFPQNSSLTDDLIVAGGIDQWRSTNGGNSFTKISRWQNWQSATSAHADQHVIIEHPQYNGTTNCQVWFGNDGGVWRVNDVRTVAQLSGWTRRNTNLGITQFYGASTHAGTGIVIGGTQDNGTTRRTAATAYNSWTFMQGGDGGYTASDPTDSNYHYGEYQNGKLRRSTNGGVSSSSLQNFTGSNFIAPFILDPNNANTLYYGAGDLWRSTNVKAGTPSWTAIHTPSGKVSAIAVKQGSSNVLWVGHNNGDVYRSTNGTAAAPTFTRRDNTTPSLPNRFVTRIVIDPKNSFHVFACFGGYSMTNVWETKNGGTTWAALTGMPSAPVRDLEIHPTNSQILYAATEVGLLVSENGGDTWSSTATPANVSINEMFWGANNKLYLATHGRGMFSQSIGDTTVPGDIAYYRFDRGASVSAINYAVSSSSYNSILNSGGDRWVTPGWHGRGMLRGSSHLSAASFNFVSTPFFGPLNGSFSFHFWMRERNTASSALSYVFGNLKTASGADGFRCFTGGIAGESLAVRGATGLSSLVMPTIGHDLQSRARGKGGVCVGLSVDADSNTAQWYLNGLAHGSPIAIPAGGAGIPASTTNLRVGAHKDLSNSCVYDLDEFRLTNRAATAAEMRAWCQGPKTLYYKFDKGTGDTVVNYGTSTAPSTMVQAGPAGPWSTPGKYGPSMLSGSNNAVSTHYNYCDTGMKGPIQGDATIHWWMKNLHTPGTSLSYLWGGLNTFRCFTSGIAGGTLYVRGLNGTDEVIMPDIGNSVHTRSTSAAGVCVTLTIDATSKKAQWYVDGMPHGQSIDIESGMNVAQSTSSFKIGKHTSNITSSAYNIDEFRLLNRVAGADEIARWCVRPTAAVGRYVPNCGISLSTLGGVPYVANSHYTHTIQMGTRTASSCLFVIGVLPAIPFDMGLAFPALSGCMWHTSFDLQVGINTDANGHFALPGGIPVTTANAGIHVDTQVLGFNPSGQYQSNVVSHVIEIDR